MNQYRLPSGIDRSRLPTFIIGGARKAGTTALWRYMKAHPEIGMGAVKEPQFFSRQQGRLDTGSDYGPPRSGNFDQGWVTYAQQFAGTERFLARGEASTMYLDAPDSADLIARHLSDVRLIFSLRNPVDRIYSHYWYECQTERLPPFSHLVENDHPRLQWYLDQTRYARHLERYLRFFCFDQILVLRSSELGRRPAETLHRAFEFVGVNPDRFPEIPMTRQNQASRARSRMLQRLLMQHKREWTKYLPYPMRTPARKLNLWVAHKNKRPAEYEPLDGVTRRILIERLSSDIDRLEQLLGWNLSEWRE